MRKSKIKKEAERAIIYGMVIAIVQRFDATYRHYGRGSSLFSGRSSLGSSLETYLIGAAVLIGEAEGRLFTANKLASFLGLARGTVQRKLDHLQRVRAVERVGVKYRVGEVSAQEAGHVDDMVWIVMTAYAALSKLDSKALAPSPSSSLTPRH
jgi:hypothetical protein